MIETDKIKRCKPIKQINMKIKRPIIVAMCFLSINFAKAQTSSLVDCGLTYYYDAAGNRILRMVVPCSESSKSLLDSTLAASKQQGLKDSATLAAFQIVMIAPNPTAGPFNVTCNQVLNNANVTIVDMNGQVVSQSTVSGSTIPMDISRLAPGAYTVIVNSNGSQPTAKTLIKMSGH